MARPGLARNFWPETRTCKHSKLAYQSPFMAIATPHLERSLSFLFADISRLARKEFDRRVRDLGLTRAQWLFLYYLARQPGCTQSDLAELLQMEKITVSRQADRLEKAGWIKRSDSAEDARAYRLKLTPRAGRIIAQLEARAERLRNDYLEGLSLRRRASLLADLTLVKANLQSLVAQPR
jgi:MarR family transcriptional regulator, transcriptional regulator for hemolysin